MPLIKQIFEAVQNGNLHEPFTVESLKQWVLEMRILKDDGAEYADSSINAILSNSDLKNDPTTNLNKKTLNSRVNEIGAREYWFP